ncbi:MAG: hypothetical protein H8D23_01600, partial [Candidatus Brocadiales bacterium]|nr:hypothetical protein [Candidatus Brocadiales bacterium]
MDYGKMTKDELISKLNSLKSKLEDLENKKSEGERRTPEKILQESMEKELIKAQKFESIGVFA